MPATSYPPAEEPRSVYLRLLVTPTEKRQLVALSESKGVPVAEIVRTALPLDPETESASA